MKKQIGNPKAKNDGDKVDTDIKLGEQGIQHSENTVVEVDKGTTQSNNEELTDSEKRLLAKCEAIIVAGQETFIEVGTALAVIKQDKLYRAEYSTFEEYCRKKWEFTRSQAYRLIDACEVVREMTVAEENTEAGRVDSDETTVLPKSEFHARLLKNVANPLRKRVMATAAAKAKVKGEKVTSSHIKAAKEEIILENVQDQEPTEQKDDQTVKLKPIVKLSDLLDWVVEVKELLEKEEIGEALETLEEIECALESYIKHYDEKGALN